VIIDGYVYSGHSGPTFGGGCVRSIELATGRLMGKHPQDADSGNRAYSLMAADGKLVILDDLGNLAIAEANPNEYKEISRRDVFRGDTKTARKFWTPPVLCNGRITCRNYAGELLCIDVSR
jgi:hypothetical protein